MLQALYIILHSNFVGLFSFLRYYTDERRKGRMKFSRIRMRRSMEPEEGKRASSCDSVSPTRRKQGSEKGKPRLPPLFLIIQQLLKKTSQKSRAAAVTGLPRKHGNPSRDPPGPSPEDGVPSPTVQRQGPFWEFLWWGKGRFES